VKVKENSDLTKKSFLNPKNAWKGIVGIALLVILSIFVGLGASLLLKHNSPVKNPKNTPAHSMIIPMLEPRA
jgi:hypothetical protein